MNRKSKIFLQALAVFLLVVGGMMLFRPAPEVTPAQQRLAAARKQETPPMPVDEEKRFKRHVDFKAGGASANGWTAGTAEGAAVFHDDKTKLVWGPMLEKPVANVLNARYLDEARAACDALEPKGAWVLPQGDEMDAAEANGLRAADKGAAQRWLVYRYIGKYPAPAGRPWDNNSAAPLPYRIRCVAKAD